MSVSSPDPYHSEPACSHEQGGCEFLSHPDVLDQTWRQTNMSSGAVTSCTGDLVFGTSKWPHWTVRKYLGSSLIGIGNQALLLFIYLFFAVLQFVFIFIYLFIFIVVGFVIHWNEPPWIYMCFPSRSPLPPPSPPDPSRSSQCTRSERLSHASNLGWWSVSP